MTTKKFVGGMLLIALALFLSLIPSIYSHEDMPPKFQDQIWPSCHWGGSDDEKARDWRVEFLMVDRKTNKTVWKHWVATGLSGKAAEQLCDAYIDTVDPNQPEK